MKFNILIVDDEEEIREILTEVLSDLPLNFFQAENGQVAQDIIKSQAIDLLITDLAMPKMNGFEFLRWLRNSGFHIPSMVLTGHGDKVIAQQVKAFGVVEFVDKPFEVENILKKVSEIIQSIARAKQST